jgi:ABC transporter substrate binding protein
MSQMGQTLHFCDVRVVSASHRSRPNRGQSFGLWYGSADLASLRRGWRKPMRRRDFIAFIGGFAIAWPLPLHAQQAAKSSRVAYLALAGDEDAALVKQRLDELGYGEGKNLIFDFRTAEGQLERLPELAAKFVATSPDVIVTGFGTETAKAAQAATTAIPIIFTSVGDPIAAGIVKSLSRPGANITGLTSQTAEISGKRLQILEELAPGIRIIEFSLNGPSGAISASSPSSSRPGSKSPSAARPEAEGVPPLREKSRRPASPPERSRLADAAIRVMASVDYTVS